MSLVRRVAALARLGGPVCPVCDEVGEQPTVRTVLGENDVAWMTARGKAHVIRSGLAPMCDACERAMTNHTVRAHAEAAAARARRDMADRAYRDQVGRDLQKQWQPNSREFLEAQSEYAEDLEEAQKLANGWGVGNGWDVGIFGKLDDDD